MVKINEEDLINLCEIIAHFPETRKLFLNYHTVILTQLLSFSLPLSLSPLQKSQPRHTNKWKKLFIHTANYLQ